MAGRMPRDHAVSMTPPRLPRGIPSLLALLAGGTTVFTFAPFLAGWLAPLPLFVLFGLWLHHAPSPRRAAWLGFLFGLGSFLGGVHWVYVSMSVYGGMPQALAALSTFLFCVYLAVYPALAGWLQARAAQSAQLGWRCLLLMPLAWTLCEALRGVLLTGFPWLSLGFSQTDTLLAGWASVLGVHGVSLLLALVAGGLLWMVSCRRGPVWRRGALLIALIYGSGWGWQHIAWTTPVGAPLSVSLLQGNIPQDLKWNPDNTRMSLNVYRVQIHAARGRLLVLPETAFPLLMEQLPEGYLLDLQRTSQQKGAALLLGLPERGSSGDYYNSMLLLAANEQPQWYRKVHLVPFGEYLPLQPFSSWVLRILHIPLADMSPGQPAQPPISLGALRIAGNICYEDLFGHELRAGAREAHLLVNGSNLAWFGNSVALPQHLQIARFRSLETGRPMLRATNTGMTAAIEFDGRVVAQAAPFRAAVVEATVQPRSGLTPYLRWGDHWLWLALLLFLAAGRWRRTV